MTQQRKNVGGSEGGFLQREQFPLLLRLINDAGYQCIGPRVRDGAIVYDTLDSVTQLPIGQHDRQAPGEYRLAKDDSPRYFAWANGPQALKPRLFSPRESLWKASRNDNGHIEFSAIEPQLQALAVFGVRACDLAALRLQDQHFAAGQYPDPHYSARRQQLLLVAVNCTHPAQTCFCVSTGDGPAATSGYDLLLSELDEGFLISSGTDNGAEIIASLPVVKTSAEQQKRANDEVAAAASQQRRALPSRNLRTALFNNLDHPRWEEVAARCLSCGNCTAVCPTCFCSSNSETANLEGTESVHQREWDSCFTLGHSYIHGVVVRAETRLRYRQWLTHKLGSWHDQYGRSGCVGCGRCISWCPVGIDLTEEVAGICQDSLYE